MSTPQSTADVKAKQSSKRKLNWSMLDDIQLTDSVRVHGFNWAHIATSLRNKTPTECRDRYEILVKNPRMTQLPSGLAGSSTQSTQVRMATRSTRQSPARSSQPALHSAPMQVQPPPVTAPPLPSDATLDFLFGASGDVFGPDISPVLDSSELESDVVTQKPDIPVATSEDSTQASRQKRRYACPHANCSSSYDIYQSYKYHVEQGCKLGTSSAIKSASAKGRPKSARSQRQALLWSEGGQVAQTPQAATPGPAADFAQFDFSSDLDEILNGTSSFDQFLLSSSQLGTTQPTIPDYQNTQHQFYNQQPMQRQYHPMMTRNAQYRFAPTDPNQRLQQPPFQQIGPSHQFLQHQQSAFPLSFTTGLSPSMGYNTRGSQRANQFSSSASSSPMHFAPLAAHPHFGHNPASFAPPSGRYQAPLREIAPKRVNTGISRGEVDSLFNEMFKTDGDKELVKEKEKEMESLLQCPLGVEPKWAWSSKEIFSVAQLSVLKIQMNNNFQLVAQAYVIERELHGAGAEETLHWEDQLKSLESLREWGVKGYGPTSYHNTTPIFKLDQIISLPAPTRRMPRSALSREFVRVMNYQLTETEYRERLQRSQKKNISAKNQVASSITTAPLFEGLTKLADIFRREWNRDLIPDILRVRRKKAEFLKMEDLLLIRGVISFGVNDIKGIRAHCLPGKTVDAIEGRIKSLRARSNEEKDNALKAMLLKPFKPVTILEKDIMRHGIQQRGASVFPQLLHLFPHHPVLIIEQLWMSMQMMGEVTIPVPSTSTNRLVEVDELSPVSVEDEEYSDDGIDDDDEAVEDDDSEEDQDDDDGSDENDVFALFDDAACDNDEEDTDDDDFDPNETNKGKGKEKPNSRETAEEMDEDSFLEDLLGRDVDGGDQQSEAVEPNIASHTVKKRKSVATRLPNAGSENGNDENSWSFRTKKDSKSRLRKLSLMDQTSSSTLGRGRVRGKKKTASMIPTRSEGASPVPELTGSDCVFKKPHPISKQHSIVPSSKHKPFEIDMSSEPDFGFDFGGSLFDINPFFRDGAMNQGLSNLTPAEVQGIPGTADDELERFLENAVFTDQWNETMNQNPETPHDMKLDFSFLHELCPAPELLPSTPVPPTTTSSSKALTENRNISNQANLLSSPIFNTASFNKPSPSNLLQETPVAPSSKLKEELRIRSTENTGERRSIRDENTQPAFSSDGKIHQKSRKRGTQSDRPSANKRQKQCNDENALEKKARRSDMAMAAALAGKNVLGPV